MCLCCIFKRFLSAKMSVCMRYSLSVLERFSEVYGPECIQIISLPFLTACKGLSLYLPPFPPVCA